VDMSVRPGVSAVLRELYGPYDEWDIARWFSTANRWLPDIPMNALVRDPGGVLQAARADRFIARW
jgi:hypothetical protein